uniref:Ceramide synthase 4 n=1 Tax=Neovison vison TaxID=452646 RepID=A0A8C7ETF8_NEOVI
MLSSLSEWFWQERLWLPPNNTWAALEDRDGLVYPHARDLLAALPVALALVVMRLAFERFVGLPLGRLLGVRDQTRRPAKPNATLEKYFLTEGWKPKEVRAPLLPPSIPFGQPRPPCGRGLGNGMWPYCQEQGSPGRPLHTHSPLQPALYYWYLLELSFYVSLLITLPFDVRRKDFKEQVTHHFVTILLISFSYSSNLLRIGSLVLLLHDASDYLLEAGKMFNYTHWRKVCDTLFIIFSLVFFYTRLVLFPTQILYTTYYESIAKWGPFFGYYFFNVLLVMLQLLHVFWSCLILRMIYSFMKKGRVGRKERRDPEGSARVSGAGDRDRDRDRELEAETFPRRWKDLEGRERTRAGVTRKEGGK